MKKSTLIGVYIAPVYRQEKTSKESIAAARKAIINAECAGI